SVVEARAAAAAEAPWPFVVHVNAGGNARRTVWGSGSAGDDDLVLHYAVSRASGWAAFGPSAPKRIGAIATGVVQHQLAKELRWALTHASETYAILNACRALRFRAERVLCSKTDGGNWARDHGIEPDFVRRAMHDRRAGVAARIAPDVAAWVAAVADEVDA
ncbi:MAG TPA: aminoglycoside adenylyltransferase domain-containing protein, partial [Acidimicrobiia bacterium]|nr:aminoglycoside adenylyltransferase domain-containing protein [Acidimicrobiia bacterium]